MADKTITGAPVYLNGRIRLPHARGYYEFNYAGPLPQAPGNLASNFASITAKLDRLIALAEAANPSGKPPA